MGHVKHGRNFNPFGNIATVTSQCVVQDVALVDHADIVCSICNIFYYMCVQSWQQPTQNVGKTTCKKPVKVAFYLYSYE